MTRRRALAVFAAAVVFVAALNALVYSLYRSEVRAVSRTLDDRLTALGATTARWLPAVADGGGQDALLAALVAENRLEDAYVLDAGLRVVAGARTRAGTELNLLRVDEERLAGALDGRSSVGDGYSVEHAEVTAGYFGFVRGDARFVLALEAGAEYHAPAAALYATYLTAVALTLGIAVIFGVGLVLALRALERARLAHGRAERLAAVGQMAAMVAHEVRNPLGILRGQVELARERLGDQVPTREQERFVEMLSEIDRLNRLTGEFLSLARDAPLDRADVELGELAAETVEAARLATAAGGARLEVATPPAPIVVDGDRGRLRQALYNLILNAVQVGGPEVTVRVAAKADGDGRARLSVEDDGPGVPPELAKRLFEPFVSARPGGSGLGLTVARRVAEQHGGTLGLEPPPPGGRGACFSIHLPCKRGA
jgi:signal transduction histidine kinase